MYLHQNDRYSKFVTFSSIISCLLIEAIKQGVWSPREMALSDGESLFIDEHSCAESSREILLPAKMIGDGFLLMLLINGRGTDVCSVVFFDVFTATFPFLVELWTEWDVRSLTFVISASILSDDLSVISSFLEIVNRKWIFPSYR